MGLIVGDLNVGFCLVWFHIVGVEWPFFGAGFNTVFRVSYSPSIASLGYLTEKGLSLLTGIFKYYVL